MYTHLFHQLITISISTVVKSKYSIETVGDGAKYRIKHIKAIYCMEYFNNS